MKNLISKCCGSEVKIQFHKGSGAKLEYCSKCKHYCDTIEQNEEEKEEVKNCGFCWGKIENGICKRCGATIKDNEDMFCKDMTTKDKVEERIRELVGGLTIYGNLMGYNENKFMLKIKFKSSKIERFIQKYSNLLSFFRIKWIRSAYGEYIYYGFYIQ